MKRKFLYNANKTLLLVMLLIIGFAFVFTAYSAYSIIQEQNGTIKAENRKEGGSRFTIKFYKGDTDGNTESRKPQ